MRSRTDNRLVVAGILLLAALATACQQEASRALHGTLYFAAGPYLASLDLGSGATAVEANFGDAEVLSLGAHLGDLVVVSVYGSVNNRDRHRLFLYDLETRQRSTLLNGRNGRYLPGTRTLVYDQATGLNVTRLVNGVWEKTLVERHSYGAHVAITPISESRFLYAIDDDVTKVYDMDAGSTVELVEFSRRCSLDGALWEPTRDRALCWTAIDEGSYEYAFVALDGTVHEMVPLPADSELLPVAFLPDQDALVLTEEWRGLIDNQPQYAIWAYHFSDQALHRLAENQHLGSTVIYKPLQ